MKFKEIAEEANEIENEIGLDIDDILNKLTQELGEFNDAVQKFRGRYARKELPLEEVEGEAGDLFFNFISVCNRIGINPDRIPDLAKLTLNKFKERKQEYKEMLKGK